jgi:hypothetical protein
MIVDRRVCPTRSSRITASELPVPYGSTERTHLIADSVRALTFGCVRAGRAVSRQQEAKGPGALRGRKSRPIWDTIF